MAIWISWNIDILRSLNSRDSFPISKFENRAQLSCRSGAILSLPSISFELHAKTATEIDPEKCNFRNFRSSVTLTLTLDRVEVTLVRISGRGLPTHQIRAKLEKLFVDGSTCVRMDGRTDTTSNSRSIRPSTRRWPTTWPIYCSYLTTKLYLRPPVAKCHAHALHFPSATCLSLATNDVTL